MREYSRMKYGVVEATNQIADSLFSKIIKMPPVISALNESDNFLISSAAYGSVPTASHAIMRGIVDRFSMRGLNIQTFKVEREGSFHVANYGSLDLNSRQDSLNSRHIYISDEVSHLISNKTVLIIDDLLATGTHETSLINLFSQHAPKKLLFAYPLAFETEFGHHSPNFESVLNDAQIKDIEDLLSLTLTSEFPLLINARLLKFIFKHGPNNTEKMTILFDKFGYDYCLSLHSAAISSDRYSVFDEYKAGFELLKTYLRGARLDVD